MNKIFINRHFRAGTSGSTSLTGENSQAKDVIIVRSRAGVSRCPAFWSSSSSPTRSSKGLYLVRNSVQIFFAEFHWFYFLFLYEKSFVREFIDLVGYKLVLFHRQV